MARLHKSLILLVLAFAHATQAESWIDKFLGRGAHNKGVPQAEQVDQARGHQELEGGNWIVENLPAQGPARAMAAHRAKAPEGGQGMRRFLAGHMKGMEWMGRDKGVYQEEDVLTTPTPTSSTTETTNSRSLTSTVYEPLTYQVPESIATRIVFSPPFGAPASSTSVVVNQASAVFRPPAQAIPQAIANRVIFKGAAKGDSAAKGAKSGAEADSADMTKTQASGLGQRKSPTATEP